MKYVRFVNSKIWHEYVCWLFPCYHDDEQEIEAFSVCFSQSYRVAELVDEDHLPKGARKCKKCFPEKRK